MENVKASTKNACRGGLSKKYVERSLRGSPVPAMAKDCEVSCPAPCSYSAPSTPAEREVQKLNIQLRQTEENFKTKVTECAILRTDFLKLKEELEMERCQHRDVEDKLRELQKKFDGLNTQTDNLLETKEHAFQQEMNVKALKQCYRDAREEIESQKIILREQNDQLQDYRVKYLQAQQLVDEQRRQIDLINMDNVRIGEQINAEIQRIKVAFQDKLEELAPVPDLLRFTQMKLSDAQQCQAIAEHHVEQLARELNAAREKIHLLLHTRIQTPESFQQGAAQTEAQIALMQQRIAQLTETNTAYKNEVERLKTNVLLMEEAVMSHEKRLHEKMHECAQLGGELDKTRDEAARALQRAHERVDTIRKCMQTSVADLERQLAASRAQVKVAEKDKEQVQSQMKNQIERLNENFEEAQKRILGLQAQVQTLKRTASSTGDDQECACKSNFENS